MLEMISLWDEPGDGGVARYVTIKIGNDEYVDVKEMPDGYMYVMDCPGGEVYAWESNGVGHRTLTQDEWDDVMRFVEEQFDANGKIARLKEELKSMMTMYPVEICLACIYDLFQNYDISEELEVELYGMADPEDEFNNVHDYWYDYDGVNPLAEVME